MSSFRNLRIKTKFLIYFLLLITLGIITVAVLILNFEQAIKKEHEVDAKYSDSVHGLHNLRIAFFEQIRAVEEYGNGFISREEVDSEVETREKAIIHGLEMLEQSSYVSQERLELLSELIKEKSKLSEKVLAAASEGSEERSEEVFEALEEFDKAGDKASEVMAGISNEIEEGSKKDYEALDSRNKRFNILALAVIFGLTAAAVSAAFFVSKKISKRIEKLGMAAKALGAGDFNKKVEVDSGDELGQLAKSFNEMMQKLHDDYHAIEEKNKKLNDTLVTIEEQNKSLEETKKAMLNIMEDEKDLELALKQEKVSVEKKVQERTSQLMKARDQITQGWLQLQEEKARLTASINSLTRGFIITDLKNNVVLSNPAVEKILELGPGWTMRDVTVKLREINLEEKCKTCILERRQIDIKEVILGSKFLRVFLSPITVSKGRSEVIGTVILVEDITEAKVIERSRDEFFSIASHELRTPLTAIQGNTSLIKEFYAEKLADPEFKEMIEDIHESSVRLIAIVNDFLDTSRLELGKVEFKKEDFTIGDLAGEVIEELKAMAEEKKLYLNLEDLNGKAHVLGDRDKTKEILINLIGNSLKFTEKGGITLGIEEGPGMVKVSVRDTGRGIPVQNQPLLFRKFQQAGSSLFTRDTTKGTGLGLYISKLMAKRMGGDLVLDKSEEGKGATFVLYLPSTTGIKPAAGGNGVSNGKTVEAGSSKPVSAVAAKTQAIAVKPTPIVTKKVNGAKTAVSEKGT